MNQGQSKLDIEPYYSHIVKLIGQGFSNTSIAHTLARQYAVEGATRSSIQRFRKRHGLSVPTREKESVRVNGDEAEINTAARPYPHMDDPDAMLLERGLDPTDWYIEGATVNEWDGPQTGGSVITYHQAKLVLKRHKPLIQPARSDGWIAPKRPKPNPHKSQLIVITGDQQAPFHDERLHYLFCGWLEYNKPTRGVALGDGIDLPDVSRHRLDPENTAIVNECIQSGYDLFRGYRVASLDTEWEFMPGNHDERLRNLLLDKPVVRPLYGVKQADTEDEKGQPVLSPKFLLRFDELGINYVDPEGPYDLAQINLSSKLAVRHGWIARKGSGVSALDTLNHLGYSIIVGHTHRQSIVYHTTHDIDGNPTTLTAAEAGCMCRVNQTVHKGRKFPDFTVTPDWQQGFTTAQIWPDGKFRIDNATYVNGVLLWRDQRYE